MKRSLVATALCLAALSGCIITPDYTDVPASSRALQVELSDNLPPEFAHAALDAIDRWNEDADETVAVEVATIQRCGVLIEVGDVGGDDPATNARVIPGDSCAVTIRVMQRMELEPEWLPRLIQHELGHVLLVSAEHSDDENDVMSPVASSWQMVHATAEQVERVRARYGAQR